MTALIIDDEPLARLVVREYLLPFPQVQVAAECSDGFEGLKSIREHKPDLIFLDIQMPKINGFEMLELVEVPPAVIFTTAFDEYAIRAFEAHAVDYLLKPFSPERFGKAVEKFITHASVSKQMAATGQLLQSGFQTPSQSERVVVKNGGKIKIIMVPQIHYLEAADDYVKIHTADGVFLKNKTLSFYESSLPPQSFVRIHRSYLVNVHLITRIDPYEKEGHLAILKSDVRLPVSKPGYVKLKAVLGF